MLTYADKVAIKTRARELVFAAERAVNKSASCGFLGDVQNTIENLARRAGDQPLEALCDRQRRSIANMKAMLARLQEACDDSQFDHSERIIGIGESIADDAMGIVDETQLSSWRAFLAAYSERVGETIGDVAGAAADVATGAAKGVVQGLGPAWTLILLFAAAYYLAPARGD